MREGLAKTGSPGAPNSDLDARLRCTRLTVLTDTPEWDRPKVGSRDAT